MNLTCPWSPFWYFEWGNEPEDFADVCRLFKSTGRPEELQLFVWSMGEPFFRPHSPRWFQTIYFRNPRLEGTWKILEQSLEKGSALKVERTLMIPWQDLASRKPGYPESYFSRFLLQTLGWRHVPWPTANCWRWTVIHEMDTNHPSGVLTFARHSVIYKRIQKAFWLPHNPRKEAIRLVIGKLQTADIYEASHCDWCAHLRKS